MGQGMAGGAAAQVGRRAAMLLAAAPVAPLLAVAAMASMHDISSQRDVAPCSYSYLPLYQGYEEEVRALVSREGWPVWREGQAHLNERLYEYVKNNSRCESHLGVIYSMLGPGERTSDEVRAAGAVVYINQFNAPPGGCVWEHECIAGGGSLAALEYDRGLKCYLAGGDAGSPAPYELADEQTRRLVERAGPAPPGAGALEYVRQNTRVDMILRNHMDMVEKAVDRAGGNAYRAIKALNVNYEPQAMGFLREQAWINSGWGLSGLEYSEAKCYMAPAWAMDDGLVDGVCNGAALADWRFLAPNFFMEDFQGPESEGGPSAAVDATA